MTPGRSGSGLRPELRPLVTLLLVAVVVMAATATLRGWGWLRSAELAGHDLIVTIARHVSTNPDPGVVILGIDDFDKAELGWPLPDRTVVQIIEELQALEPAAIGVDFFRGDMPVGPLGLRADPADTSALVELVRRSPTVVLIVDTFRNVLPPLLAPLVEPGVDRLASPNLAPDHDDVLRRGLLGDVFPDPQVGEPVYELWSLAAALVQVATVNDRLGPAEPTDDDVVPLGRRAIPPLMADQGPYAGSDEVGGGYEFLASWPIVDLPTYGLNALLEHQIDKRAIKDKIVLVGSVARSVGDVVTSPVLDQASKAALPRRSVFGVEAHAQLTAQLLGEARGTTPSLHPAPASHWMIGMAVASLAGAVAGGFIASPFRSIPVLILGSVFWPAVATVSFVGGLWMAWVPSVIGWVFSMLMGFILVAWRERRQRARLAGLFRTYLPPTVADALWNNRERLLEGGRPAPQSMVATVLFSDVRGFTTVSESMQPRELLEWLEAFHELMTDCIAAEGGIVADFMGDGMMAVFGVPVPSESEQTRDADAVAAVRAALSIRARLPVLSRKLQDSGRPGIAIRIGIHTGQLVAGAIGGKARLQYTILGDTVNTAARLESLSLPSLASDGDHCRILISEATLQRLGGRVHAEPVGLLPLKGKADPVRGFRIMDADPDLLGVQGDDRA